MNTHPTHTHVWKIVGLDCPTCAKELETEIRSRVGVAEAELDFMGGTVRVSCTLEGGCEAIIDGLADEHGVSFQPVMPAGDTRPSHDDIAVSTGPAPLEAAVMIVSGMLIVLSWLRGYFAPLPLAMLVAGWPVAGKALAELRRRTLGMNALMLIAAVGAGILGEWQEGAMVLFLYAIAKWLERISSEKARSSIEALRRNLPSLAHLVDEAGNEHATPISQIQTGEKIRIRPGETIPMDGMVIEGSSSIDESSMTGESTLVAKSSGSELLAGTQNIDGMLLMAVTAPASESRFSRIMMSVQKAQARKTAFQSAMERFAAIYTPAVVAIAVAVAVLPPLFGIWTGIQSVYAALVLLVIACPCSLVLASPVTLVSAMAAAARSGILIRSGSVLEEAAAIRAVAFDKTGTITVGEPEILGLFPMNGMDEAGLLRITASLEAGSEHPLAPAFRQRAHKTGIALLHVEGFKAVPGHGVIGCIGTTTYRFGEAAWALENCSEALRRLPDIPATCVTASALCDGSRLLGIVTMGDRIRPEAKEAIARMHESGVTKTFLLSGDREETAREYAEVVGITAAEGRLTPEAKCGRIESLTAAHGPVMMVGDGINDTPALATAAVGVAMGTRGSDAALETAGAVLLHDDLRRLPLLISLAHRADRIVRQNIAVSIGLKITVFALSLSGLATLWMAVLADTGASVIVVMNGLRALKSPRWK
ncbi:MAG TPA: cation-translocating P-type ATPase [Candidatus Ozemobacteraceae bacterium]|nr:cation-translocating P-type ATPase [Candidatus Ozemobacteraceae bacterium]